MCVCGGGGGGVTPCMNSKKISNEGIRGCAVGLSYVFTSSGIYKGPKFKYCFRLSFASGLYLFLS